MLFGQVLQIPQDGPIFKREISNNMYSVHAYWMSMVTRAILTTWIYPVLLTITSFFWSDLPASSAADMFNYMACLACVAVCGNFFGLMMGAAFDIPEVALGLANLYAMISGFGAGLFANTGDGANWFVTFLSWISPLRYGCEILMR